MCYRGRDREEGTLLIYYACLQVTLQVQVSSIGTGKLDICRRMKLEPYLSSFTKLNYKWIKGLNGKSDTARVKSKTHSMRCWQRSGPSKWDIRLTIDRWDLLKLKLSAWQRKLSIEWRDSLQNEERNLHCPYIWQRINIKTIQSSQKKIPRK